MRGFGLLVAACAVPAPMLDFLPPILPARWRLRDQALDGAVYDRADGLLVILSAAVELDGRRWLHVSASYPKRLPTWEDLADVKAVFVGAERCPAVDLPDENGRRARCVRDEDHASPHVGAGGEEWLVALRCQRDARLGGPPSCARILGHEGDCRPLPAPVHVAATPMERRRRGVCRCGKPRQEHEGGAHTGGVNGTACARYRP